MVPLPHSSQSFWTKVMLHTTAAPPDLGVGHHPSSYPRQSLQLKLLLVTLNIIIFTAPSKKIPGIFSEKTPLVEDDPLSV